jgi:hypothetical protein
MKLAAIFPVGTSVGGAPDAIREILSQAPELDVYLLYGEPGRPPGERATPYPTPQEAAEEIRRQVPDPRVVWGQSRMVPSFEFPATYEEFRKFIREIGGKYDRIYVGVTGGTNPMVASLFQASMAYLKGEVVPIYVQAKDSTWQKNFIASEIRDRVMAEEALAMARAGQIRAAADMAQRHLPSAKQWEFVSQSLIALAQWDDFDYCPQAAEILERQANACGAHGDDELRGPLAGTVARIAPCARRISEFSKQLRALNNFSAAASAPGWPQRVEECGTLLVADALANAKRRSFEGRPTDSVLRAYRAAECATQMRLFKLGIHPSKPSVHPPSYQRYVLPFLQTSSTNFRGNNQEVRENNWQVTFKLGIELLEFAGELDSAPLQEAMSALRLRNTSYLEHGYVRVSPRQAENCFARSLEICRCLLGPAIDERWREFEMRF